MANDFYGATNLIGGAAGALDAIDGSVLADKDGAVVITATSIYHYHLDDNSGAAESSPQIIAPDDNPGDKRWLLRSGVFEDVTVYGGIIMDGTYSAAGATYALQITSTIYSSSPSQIVAGINVAPSMGEQSSGTQPLMTGIRVAPTFVDNAGSTTTIASGVYIDGFAAAAGTVNAVGLYIKEAPTGASNNYALWVAAGNAIFTDNVGFGVSTLESWFSGFTVLQIGRTGNMFANTAGGAGQGLHITQNAYSDGDWKYQDTDEASRYAQYSGTHGFYVVASGTADTEITWVEAMMIDVSGNVNIAGVYKVDGTQVVSNRVIDERIDDTIDSGDATTDGVIDALRDAAIAHGLIAAA